ncbi:MAG: three-Cys-motif partner protein TcmP [Planctomycetota bacterium]|nr:three-Cys-motif partner protein TcmP [Planctomycetota bacterium]
MTKTDESSRLYDSSDLVPSSDGLPAREVGPWSKDKHYFLIRYMDAFTRAMKRKPQWSGLGYIDLFAGPGKCKIRGTGEEIYGSPLIALTSPRPGKSFDAFFFAEMSSHCLEAITTRFHSLRSQCIPNVYPGDCNEKVSALSKDLNSSFLYLAFIDPPGLDVHFDTIRALANQQRMDLIISFMDRLDLNRNMNTYLAQQQSKLDLFFGERSNWRHRFNNLGSWSAENVTRLSLEIYRDQLQQIGYGHFGEPVRIHGAGETAQTPFYLLLFASKHPLGVQFWNETSSKDRSGNRKLPF